MEIVKVLYNGNGEISHEYSQRDDVLITNNFINSFFGDQNDVVEYFITDENGIQLKYSYDSKDYYVDEEISSGTNKFSKILLDPEKDVKSNGFTRGKTNIQYNFHKNLFNSSFQNTYWIKEISNSRLELKLSSQTISGDDMARGVQSYQIYASQKNYYSDFYLNFGNNDLIIAVNAAYVNDNNNSYLLVKLYEPLPIDFDLKSTLWIVDRLGESTAYEIDIQVEAEQQLEQFKLRGPNFKIKTTEKIGQTTPYYSYNSLFSSPVSSSIQQLMSYYEDKAIQINVDYTNFNNFVHFSSATERVRNFVYKLQLIENYNKQIYSQSAIIGNNEITSGSIQNIQSNIDNIISKFDHYEYYLYYASESFAWPKRTSTKPYSLYSVTSSNASNWLGSSTTLPTATSVSILYSSSYYDATNKDMLSTTAVPQYIIDDPNNQAYITFLDMIGQHFDNIWVYYKDVSNRFNATNNPNTGVSMDLVADALKGLGIELYTNTNLSDNIFYTLFGYNQDGSLLPPTGSEKNIQYVTSSLSTLPYDQTTKEIYKRIYHNLPYLLKTKGTSRGIKALISCYGIPESILSPLEFGGYDRANDIGVIEQNDSKVTIIPTGSNELYESVLSPYTTLQTFDNDNRKNSTNLEIGFSPSDIINSDISSSLGYFSIDNLIGNPALQYSSSYGALDNYKDNYFSSYTKKHSIWEYIRLIRYYNNSLFKMIKDFVPARSNVSTGIIIKPHILERNKYARHEPSASFQNYSESIDTAFISGSPANSYNIDSTVYSIVTSSIGYIPVTKSFSFENYTGEYQGTNIVATSLNSVGYQTEVSKNALTASLKNLEATYQNITSSVRSQKYLDLDYGWNAIRPVNFDIIKNAISNSQVDNYSTYTNPNNPFAELQDFNYFAQRSTIPRYYGSKVESLTYNTYSTASVDWKGDSAYGNSPAIDLRSKKIALFTQLESSSFFRGKVNARLAYLVDAKTGLFELNLTNNNWFEVQNIFKSGKNLTIKQFDNRKYSNQKRTDGIKAIYESGYSYSPIMYFSQLVDTKVYFNYYSDPGVTTIATNTPDEILSNVNNRYVSGSGANIPSYPFIPTGIAKSSSMYNAFDYEILDDQNNYTAGDSSSRMFATYSVTTPGDYTVNASLPFNYEVSSSTESGSISILLKVNNTVVASSNYIIGEIYIPGGGGGSSTPPNSVTSYNNYMVMINNDPNNLDRYRFSAEYIGSDRISYGGKYYMPAGNYTASILIRFMKGAGTTATNYFYPATNASLTPYYSNISWRDQNSTQWQAASFMTGSGFQSPEPVYLSRTIDVNFLMYGTTTVTPNNSRNCAQLVNGYISLTSTGVSAVSGLRIFGSPEAGDCIIIPSSYIYTLNVTPRGGGLTFV